LFIRIRLWRVMMLTTASLFAILHYGAASTLHLPRHLRLNNKDSWEGKRGGRDQANKEGDRCTHMQVYTCFCLLSTVPKGFSWWRMRRMRVIPSLHRRRGTSQLVQDHTNQNRLSSTRLLRGARKRTSRGCSTTVGPSPSARLGMTRDLSASLPFKFVTLCSGCRSIEPVAKKESPRDSHGLSSST